MAAISILAEDLKTNRIVHIEDVAEGYSKCVCASCGEQMIASNHNPDSRLVATYFRHEGGRNCSSETALHLYAKQVIKREQKVILPAFIEGIELKNADGVTFSRQLSIPSFLAHLHSIELEKSLPNSSRIPDVSADEVDGDELFIEINVYHEVDEQKASELQALELDVIEINLLYLLERKRLSKEDIDQAVIEDAPRKWVSQCRFNDRIERQRAELQQEVDRDNQRIAEDAKAARRATEVLRQQKREAKQKWRTEHQSLLDLISRYSKDENRETALKVLERRLSQYDYPENGTYQWLLNECGSVPDIVNIAVKGELAFGVHRICWQTLIFRDIICKEFDKTLKKIEGQRKRSRRNFYGYENHWLAEMPGITPQGVYNYLQSRVSLNLIASEFEKIAGEPLSEKFAARPSTIQHVMVKEYELLPKPVPAIRRYLNHLTSLGILDPSADVYYIPFQNRPTLKINS